MKDVSENLNESLTLEWSFVDGCFSDLESSEKTTLSSNKDFFPLSSLFFFLHAPSSILQDFHFQVEQGNRVTQGNTGVRGDSF